VRHLAPLLAGRTIGEVRVNRPRIVAPNSPSELASRLRGATFSELIRRGKYLLFTLRSSNGGSPVQLVGHLGMTGRMYLLPAGQALPKHAAVVMDLGSHQFVFEDTRYFGRLTLDGSGLVGLGPEPLGNDFTVAHFSSDLKRSAQPIKVKLLDQSVVAGIGNIYASEVLFRAKISPRKPAKRITAAETKRLWRAIREVLTKAIRLGSTVPLDFEGKEARDGLFYYGSAAESPGYFEERLRVYDRPGKPCVRCRTPVRRIVQAARSTFYCPKCQRG
jgi:formamidopyrimidine-DNA glycosylase